MMRGGQVEKNYIGIVEELVARPTEEEWFEFKENWFDPTGLGRYVSALSNAAVMAGRKSAYLVWGVRDGTHEVVGTDFRWHRDVGNEPLEHWLARQLSPDVALSFHDAEVSGHRCVVMDVGAAKTVPTAFAGERYVRIGSSRERLSRYPERESLLFAVLRNGLPTVENVRSPYQDLSFTRLFTYYAGRGIELRERTFRGNLGLLTEDGDYNLLAQLLSDNSHIPVRVSIFRGEDKASPLYSVREFGNTCLLVSLDKVLEYGDVLNIIQADERDRVVERKDVPLFDPACWREVVVNAFVHNRWVDGDAPMFTFYRDRVEVLSHGVLAPRQTVEGFFAGESVPVNKALSDVILQLHISERSGRGVPKIVKRYGRDAFDLRERSIAVTLPFERVEDGPVSAGAQEQEVRPSLNPTRRVILDAMRDDPNVTQARLESIAGIGRTAVSNNIAWLRRNGYVERVGSPKTGWWRVL